MTIEMRCLDCLDMLPTLADRLPKLEAEFQQAAEAHAILAADKDEFDDPRNPTALAAAHQARKELDGPCGRLRRLCDQGLHTFTPPPGQVAEYVGVAGAIITNPKCQACDGVRFAYYVSDDERPHLEAMLKADRYFPVPAEIHDGPAPKVAIRRPAPPEPPPPPPPPPPEDIAALEQAAAVLDDARLSRVLLAGQFGSAGKGKMLPHQQQPAEPAGKDRADD